MKTQQYQLCIIAAAAVATASGVIYSRSEISIQWQTQQAPRRARLAGRPAGRLSLIVASA